MTLEENIRAIVVAVNREERPQLMSEFAAVVCRLLDERIPRRDFTRREVAELKAVSINTIDRMCADGRLQTTRVGRGVRILASSLDTPSEAEVSALATEARAPAYARRGGR